MWINEYEKVKNTVKSKISSYDIKVLRKSYL